MSGVNEQAFREDGRWLDVHYECQTCGVWSCEWSCECDDDCPSCGATYTAADFDDLTADVIAENPHLAPYAAQAA